MEKQKPKLAAIYARVSSDKQKKEETIESQIDSIQEYAKAKEYDIIKEWIFRDEAESGKFLDRPGLDALRDLARDGGPDVIIIHEPDRLARKSAYQVLLLEEFQKTGIEVEFVKYKPAETPEEQFALDMMGVFAEYERVKIADRCRRGRIYKAKMGKLSILPHAPYGYIRHKVDDCTDTFKIDLAKSNIVKEIFFLYTHEKYSLGAICTHLDAKGISTPKNGKHWERSTLRDILKNETYIGTAYFGKTEKCDGIPNRIVRYNGKKITKARHARKERPKDSWIPIAAPGFITESDFQEAQELLEKNKKFSYRNTKELSLLQGLLVCKKCGRSFYKKLRGKVTSYCCNSMLQKDVPKCGARSVNQPELDSLVWDEVIRLLKDPSHLENEIARRAEEDKQNIGKHLKQEKIEKELAQLSKAKNKLLDAYQDGDSLSLAELRHRMEKIKMKTVELETQLKIINNLKEQQEKNIDIKATLEYFERRLAIASTELSMMEKQKVVRLLIEEIVIDDESLKIMHCIPPRSAQVQNSPLCGVRCGIPPGLLYFAIFL
jgi:site-specific DNA recombinase